MTAFGVTVLDLEQPRFEGMPLHPAHQQAGYSFFLHRRHQDWENPNARSSAAGMLICSDHSGTHIDALCHQAEGMLMCGDVAVDVSTQTPKGFTKLGIETLRPIYSRGVMLDVPAALGIDVIPQKYLVTAADLEECLQRQGTTIKPGDTLLIRTGNGRFWRDTQRYFDGPAIGSDASQWLAAQAPVAVGADNVGWDLPGFVDPVLGDLPGHIVLLVRAGVHIIESIHLEPLAEISCYEFEFVCSPLKLQGATASPVRPLAIVR
ncbi:cyclase family protein [Microbacterium sp. BWT-B31]|uniref:cyclase family protein n=1 Tax=Microbacterium sp. BWT-B31 TaxID=3232072 RepID=UPI003529C69D